MSAMTRVEKLAEKNKKYRHMTLASNFGDGSAEEVNSLRSCSVMQRTAVFIHNNRKIFSIFFDNMAQHHDSVPDGKSDISLTVLLSKVLDHTDLT